MKSWEDIKSEIKSISEVERRSIRLTQELIGEFANRRRAENITQTRLGKVAELKQGYIARVETGSAVPKLDSFIRLVDSLGYELVLKKKKSNVQEEKIDTVSYTY